MKRSTGLILAGSLTAVVLVTILFLGLSTFISPTQASTPQVSQVDMKATAQAIQFQNQQTEAQALLQTREAALQAQITQSQQAMADLDNASQAQIAKLRAQLVDLNDQVKQATANVQAAQTHAGQLQTVIQQDGTSYKEQLATLQANMTGAEQQLQNELATANSQLQAAYNKIAQRQAAAANAQSGGGGGNGGHEDDYGKGHEDHEEEDEHEDEDD